MWIALCESTSVVVHFCQHNFPKCHHAYIRITPVWNALEHPCRGWTLFPAYTLSGWLSLHCLLYLIQQLLLLTIVLPENFLDNKCCLRLQFWLHSSAEERKPVALQLKACRKFQSFLPFSYFLRAHYLICLRPLASLLSCTSGSETCNT